MPERVHNEWTYRPEVVLRGLLGDSLKRICMLLAEAGWFDVTASGRLPGGGHCALSFGGRYSTQASVSRLAQERGAGLPIHDVYEETRLHLQEQAKERGDFQRVQACPPNFNEVPDEPEARLVILGPEYLHASKQTDSAAREYAAQILDRGGAGRNCPNMLVFLVADQAKWSELEQAVRLQMAWKSIVKDIGQRVLNVDLAQADQAQKKLDAALETVRGRIPECFQWLLVPGQAKPISGEKFHRLNGRKYGFRRGKTIGCTGVKATHQRRTPHGIDGGHPAAARNQRNSSVAW